jgi:hypothetical protein
MNGRLSPQIGVLRRRLMVMIAINAICVLVAVASMVGALNFHIGWMKPAFVVALLIGFGAQVWLFAGLMRSGSERGDAE